MRILVADRKKELSKETVLADLKRYYAINHEAMRTLWGRQLSALLEEMTSIGNAEIFFTYPEETGFVDMDRQIKETSIDLLVSYDLTGFEFVTLTDNYSYNLYTLPQIHICSPKEKESVDAVTAVNMFFYEVEPE